MQQASQVESEAGDAMVVTTDGSRVSERAAQSFPRPELQVQQPCRPAVCIGQSRPMLMPSPAGRGGLTYRLVSDVPHDALHHRRLALDQRDVPARPGVVEERRRRPARLPHPRRRSRPPADGGLVVLLVVVSKPDLVVSMSLLRDQGLEAGRAEERATGVPAAT